MLMREYLRRVGITLLLSILPKYALRAARVIVHVQNALKKAAPTPMEARPNPLPHTPATVLLLFRTDCAKVRMTPLTTDRMIWHHQLKIDKRMYPLDIFFKSTSTFSPLAIIILVSKSPLGVTCGCLVVEDGLNLTEEADLNCNLSDLVNTRRWKASQYAARAINSKQMNKKCILTPQIRNFLFE
jgi:hypothetical protein